jgi:hypothetical protein
MRIAIRGLGAISRVAVISIVALIIGVATIAKRRHGVVG